MAMENRKHKDSVFCDLFYSDQDARKHLLELYNALSGTNYTDPQEIQLVRLDDVLFKNFKNDVAFMVKDERIIINEHQSTINPNMPLRDLMYIAREYERIVPARKRYHKALIRIPTPVFYTFYNGEEDYPVEEELRLSDAFKDPETAALELKVKVININKNKNHEILDKCEILREYSEFVEMTRIHKDDKEALETAVRECIRKGILKDYLERKSGEVVNMLMDVYDYDTDIAAQREEAREEGDLKRLIRMIIKKMEKKKSIMQIADDLEESEKIVQFLMNIIMKHAPEYDEEMILQDAMNRKSYIE